MKENIGKFLRLKNDDGSILTGVIVDFEEGASSKDPCHFEDPNLAKGENPLCGKLTFPAVSVDSIDAYLVDWLDGLEPTRIRKNHPDIEIAEHIGSEL